MTRSIDLSVSGRSLSERSTSARRRLLLLAAALLSGVALVPVPLSAQTFARVSGVVQDEAGNPIEGVKIIVSDPSGSFRKEYETNKKGRYTVALADATRPYLYRLEKEGNATVEEMYKAPAGAMEQKDFVLTRGTAKREPAAAPDQPTGQPAVDAFNEGAQAFQRHEYEAAVERFEQARKLDPDMRPVHSALARAYFQTERYQDALVAAERALEIDAGDAAALDVRYRSYEALGDEAAAERAKRELAAVAQPEVLAFNTGVEALRQENLPLAEESFRKAIELDPDLAPAHAALSTVLLKQQHYEEALAAADATLALDPDNVSALGVRYDSLRALGRKQEAEQAKADLAAEAPATVIDSFLGRGLELFNANRIEEAKQNLEEVLAIDPDHARAHYALGLCYVNLGNIPQAKHHLERFVELAPPDDPEAAAARDMLSSL